MKQIRRLIPVAVFLIAAILFSSCSHLPRQARYLPKDAMAVIGVHTGKMRKELAWSAILGSGLMDELRKAATDPRIPAAMKDLENAGIDFSGTLYGYTLRDTRFPGEMKTAAVLPLADGAKLEAYVKRHFPAAIIQKEGKITTAVLERQLSLGWNDEVAILMNDVVRKVSRTDTVQVDTALGLAMDLAPISWTEEIADTPASIAELTASLQPAKDSGLDGNERFAKLEKAGHDISYWMNYDAVMDELFDQRTAGQNILSASVAQMVVKGSAMATGFDFRKGEVDGLMRYYPSDSLKEVAREFGKENVDADMLRRLPAAGLNMAGALRISPAGVKALLGRLNLSGVANLALMSQGLTLDDVLGGFTGDIVFALNNFRMDAESSLAGMMPDAAPQGMATSPKMDFVIAMKIGDKARLEKLLHVAGNADLLQATAPNIFTVHGSGNTVVKGDKYIAVSSNEASAQAFLREHAGAMPDAVHQEISGHPAGLWVDLQTFFKAFSSIATVPEQAERLAILQKSIRSVSMNGGEMKDGANEYRLKLRLGNASESSLLQMLQIAQQLAVLGRPGSTVSVMR